MNKLLSTTALVVAISVPGMAFAQATSTTAQTQTQQQAGTMAGFMAARGQSDILASELMGHDVYARRAGQSELQSNDGATGTKTGQDAVTAGQAQTQGNQAHMNADGSRGMEMMNRSDIETMDQIGKITEIILSNDGEVRAFVIGVGGFLGMGEQDVAVTMDQVTFMSDTDDGEQMYVILNTSADMLKAAPAYDRSAANTENMQDAAQTSTGDVANAAATTSANTSSGLAQGQEGTRAGFAAPQMTREGYSQLEVRDVSTEMLTGKSVFDTQDNDVGTIVDMLLDDQGAITNVIIDFGGFLGMGTSQASIGFEELTILTTEEYSDVRVYVDATKDQIQGLPRYSAQN